MSCNNQANSDCCRPWFYIRGAKENFHGVAENFYGTSENFSGTKENYCGACEYFPYTKDDLYRTISDYSKEAIKKHRKMNPDAYMTKKKDAYSSDE